VQQPIITPPTGAFAATQQRATANRPIISGPATGSHEFEKI
jgi:hypothetical protein